MSSAITGSVVGASAGLAIDRLVGEPPDSVHPVVWFGRAMTRLEETTYANRRIQGAGHVLIGVGAAAAIGALVERLLGRAPAAALATALCVAGSMLDDEATAVASLVRSGDVDGARRRLRSLVGRDTDELDESEISRAVIESVAENTVDAVTASWWWASLGGAPAALAHRASNTLDAMGGHRTERYARFGWASARLDDVLAYVPARLTALTVAVVRPPRAAAIARSIRRDAGRHPSPNGGVVEAAFAAALDVRLGGTNRYAGGVEDRGTLGAGRAPRVDDIDRAIRLRRQVSAAPALAAAGLVVVTQLRKSVAGC